MPVATASSPRPARFLHRCSGRRSVVAPRHAGTRGETRPVRPGIPGAVVVMHSVRSDAPIAGEVTHELRSLQLIANPPRGEHLERCIDEVIAEAQLAEASGFDCASSASTTRTTTAFCPRPLIVATRRGRAHAASSCRHFGDPAAVATIRCTWPRRDHPWISWPRAASFSVVASAISRQTFWAFLGADGAPPGAVRGERRDPATVLGGRDIFLPRQALRAGGRADSPAAIPDFGSTALVGAACGSGAPRGRLADGFVGTPSTSLANATDLADTTGRAAKAGRKADVIQMRDAWVARTRRRPTSCTAPLMAAYRTTGRPAGRVPAHARRHEFSLRTWLRPPDPRRSRMRACG